MNSPKEKADELLSFYKNYRFYIADMDCRNMAINQVNHILSLFITDCEDTRYYQEVKKEIEKL